MAYRAAITASLAASGACLAALPAAAQDRPKLEHGPPPIPRTPVELMRRPDEPRTPKPKPPEPEPKAEIHPVLADVVLGSADAPVEIVEYASMTCAACQHFHASVLPELSAGYVLAGDAKFILRDYPTTPLPAANAAAALARCAGPTRYYDVVAELFTRQTEILSAARYGELAGLMQTIGARHGLSTAEVAACIDDAATRNYIRSEAEHAPAATKPPLILVNGVAVEDVSAAGLRRAIDDALAAYRIAKWAEKEPPVETAPNNAPPRTDPGPPPGPLKDSPHN